MQTRQWQSQRASGTEPMRPTPSGKVQFRRAAALLLSCYPAAAAKRRPIPASTSEWLAPQPYIPPHPKTKLCPVRSACSGYRGLLSPKHQPHTARHTHVRTIGFSRFTRPTPEPGEPPPVHTLSCNTPPTSCSRLATRTRLSCLVSFCRSFRTSSTAGRTRGGDHVSVQTRHASPPSPCGHASYPTHCPAARFMWRGPQPGTPCSSLSVAC